MNPDLVEQITRLVISRLQESGKNQPQVLSTTEINHWNEISASMQRTTNHSNHATNNHTQALSTSEIQSWNEITNRMKSRNYEGTENTAQVKLYTHH